MRLLSCLPPLLFSLASFSAHADDAYNRACTFTGEIPVTLHTRFDNPAYNFSVDLNGIQSLAHDPAHQVHGGHGSLILGLTRYEPTLEFRVPVKGAKFSDDRACAHIDHADITVGYRNVVVYVPREVPQGSCGFTEVLAHEQKHIVVNRQILNEYAPRIAALVRNYVNANGVFPDQDPHAAAGKLDRDLKALIDRSVDEMTAENDRRQQLIDSPEEYRRVSSSCNGQLSRAATAYKNGR